MAAVLEKNTIPLTEAYNFAASSRTERVKLAESTPEWLKPADVIKNPVIRSINARALVEEVNQYLQPESFHTLATLPEQVWDKQLLNGQVQTIYIMGIFAPSEFARQASIRNLDIYKKQTGNYSLTENDIVASPFALQNDELNPKIAKNWHEWHRLVDRFHQRGVSVLIDFVSNHVAPDHPWVEEHPEYLIKVNEATAKQKPEYYHEYIDKKGGKHYFAYGKQKDHAGDDEPPWTDTLQLNYANPELRTSMIDRLRALVPYADGVRVDTAALPAYEIFRKTWGDVIGEMKPWNFWKEARAAVNQEAERLKKNFVLAAEVYNHVDAVGDFDERYGSWLYGNLLNVCKDSNGIGAVKRDLQEIYNNPYPRRWAFLTNHDLRPAVDVFGGVSSTAAALTVTAFQPGPWMIHHGEERIQANLPMQIIKPWLQLDSEGTAAYMQDQYNSLLKLRNSRLVQNGKSTLVHTDSSIIAQQFDLHGDGMVVCTNLSPEKDVRCSIKISDNGLSKDRVRVYDLETRNYIDQRIITDPEETRGLMHIKLSPWGRQIVFYRK